MDYFFEFGVIINHGYMIFELNYYQFYLDIQYIKYHHQENIFQHKE